MACYHPVAAYQSEPGAPVRLWPPMGTANLQLPCGKCVGCRTDRATMWAHRCTHEASLWHHNSFLTLTYDDTHLPADGHLNPTDLQRFIKRLRKHAAKHDDSFARNPAGNLRYFACGEYGGANQRPHYHALIFNGAFRNLKQVGKDLYHADELAHLWPNGSHKIGTVTPRSAAYVAQYNLKKQGSGNFVPGTGEWRPAPFLRMSLKPAIGATWLTKYATDLQHGYLVAKGRKHPIPRYYRDKIKESLPELQAYIQLQIEQHRLNYTGDKRDKARLEATETIHQARNNLTHNRDKSQ